MSVRTSTAEWQGDLRSGSGHMRVGHGAYDGPFSFASRFQDGAGTNPEELAAAAHAGCFSMALSAGLGRAGFTPTRIATTAKVHLEQVAEGFAITKIELETEGVVPGIDQAAFEEYAESTKKGCPISKLFTGAPVTVKATLKQA